MLRYFAAFGLLACAMLAAGPARAEQEFIFYYGFGPSCG